MSDAPSLSVRVLRDPNALEEYAGAWEELASEALEPNPFHEPWLLRPLLRAYGGGRDLHIVLVVAARGKGRRELCGLFPLERISGYRGLPVAALRLLNHDYVPLSTPLIRAGLARESLGAFFEWLASKEAKASILDLHDVTGDGAFDRTLCEHLHRDLTRLAFVATRSVRAVFQPRASSDEYLAAALSGVHLKELRRLNRRLSEIGRLVVERLGPDGDVDKWLEEFLTLEASGWKGRAGTAFACNAVNRGFLLEVGRQAFQRGRLHMLALRLDGRPIALKLSFLAPPGSFAFKIAFDESYARFSPGVLLEVENIRALHDSRCVAWMDSCAIPDHPMIDRLWLERRVIQDVVVSCGGDPGNLVVSLLPLFRWLNRRWRGLSLHRTRPDHPLESHGAVSVALV